MDKQARNMLNFMKTSDLCRDGDCLFVDFYEAYCNKFSVSESIAMACVRYLESKGYIKYGRNQHDVIVGFVLEHKAYHSAYFTWVAFRSFMVKSVLVPIAVSAITAFLTVLIAGLR